MRKIEILAPWKRTLNPTKKQTVKIEKGKEADFGYLRKAQILMKNASLGFQSLNRAALSLFPFSILGETKT
jgi:hypothetical protein